MIAIHQLTKKYKAVPVLDIGELYIPSGESVGLVGNNGAGKTTLFSLLLDLVKPTSGYVVNHGVVVHKSEAWKPLTSAFIDESFLIGYLTPEEYFYFTGELRGWNRADTDTFLGKYKAFFNGEILGRKKYLRDLSKGNQKKVGIVAAFIGNPKVVILDEPFANLDPSTQIRLKDLIRGMAEDPEVTVLVSSHDLLHVTDVCRRIVLLDRGSVVRDLQTTPETLRELEHFFSGAPVVRDYGDNELI
ncbi:ABC transporter ATP-binding protein [Sinomicrobium soli]|uniref:ABC transporter ATP-binding protein n=1 Tax=Sinomicrobium sp. N-1-3-6 TaxID=2219864 RepID=UPI000DCC412A|nr:ABC transporter ATP-binding protein [Sinomicrobium sp. N-1-3-6]RAV29423.1 ABC transporter ATP-binding protein [Sinomicrobium sp. N-1-3-6]